LSLLAILAISYSVIQPIITLLALVVFGLYYIAFKYLFLSVFDQPDVNETGGSYFPHAINHLFTGFIIEELVLTGLFFLASDENGSRSCIPQGVLMAVLLAITILFQLYISYRMKPKRIFVDLLDNNSEDGSNSAAAHPSETPVTPGGSVGMNEILPGRAAKKGSEVSGRPMDQITSDANEDVGFYPPSTWQKQRTIWLPEDAYGLSKLELQKIRAGQVDASTEGAIMNKDGKIQVNRCPPDEEWHGGVVSDE